MDQPATFALFCATAPLMLRAAGRLRVALASAPQGDFALLERLYRSDSSDPVAYYEIVRCVAQAADSRDSYTSAHSERTADYAVAIGQELGLSPDELDRLRLAALLHDIGKLGVRPFLLSKQGRLTTAERAEMRHHARHGADMLRSNRALAALLPGIELHHESWDGTGYPYGLRGEAIPLMARIIAVADTYDALTSDRPYQRAVAPDLAAEKILAMCGTRFCPETAAAFARIFARGAMACNATLDGGVSALTGAAPVH